MGSLTLVAAGRKQDIDELCSGLVDVLHGGLTGSGFHYEIVREKQKLTAQWEIDYLGFPELQEMSRALPGLRMAIAWRIPGSTVGNCIYALGIEELWVNREPKGKRHEERLWEHAKWIAEAHVF